MSRSSKRPSDRAADSTLSHARRDVLASLVASPALLLAADGADAQAELPDSSRQLWTWARTQQVLEPGIGWLDTGRMGPTLRSVLVNEYRAREALNLDFVAYTRDIMSGTAVERLVGRVAAFVGAGADEIAFTSGASGAIHAAVQGLVLEEGDEVITTSHDHPCVQRAWALRAARDGLVLREVKLPAPLAGPEQALGLIAGAVTERTRVLSFAHVQYTDGAVLPVRELCAFARQRGILTLVDGAQAVGMVDVALDELGCDFYAASLHKWLNATYGTGFLFVRRDSQDQVLPIEAEKVESAERPLEPSSTPSDWPVAMRRYGSAFRYYGPLFQPLDSVLAFHERVGHERIEARIRELAIYAQLRLKSLAGIELVTPTRPGLWAGIVSLRVTAPAPTQVAADLAQQDRIVVGLVPDPERDGDLIRVSTHIYNSHDEIERLVRGLERRVRAA